MQQEYIHLIKRLKRQPRLGMPSDPLANARDALKGLFANYKAGYQDVIRNDAFGYIAKQAQDAYDKINVLEERNQGLSESFDVSTKRAAQFGYQFDILGKSLGVNAQKLKIYAGELKALFPAQAAYMANSGKFGKQILKQTELLRNKFGVSEEAAIGFAKAQMLMGDATAESNDKILNDIADFGKKNRGLYEGLTGDVIETIGTMGAEAVAMFERNPQALFESVKQAKKLGLEMSKIKDIGKSTLDIEQSIADEIELQILGAENLDFSKVRNAMLSGDMLTIEKEIASFLENNGEQLKTNPPLLEKAASVLQMSGDELMAHYAQLKANNALEKESEAGLADRLADTKKLIDAENAARVARGEKVMDSLKEEEFLNDKRTELKKQEDQAQEGMTENLLEQYKTMDAFETQVGKLADNAKNYSTNMVDASKSLITALSDSNVMKSLYGAGSLAKTLNDLINLIKSGGSSTTYDANLGNAAKDLFIPAGGANTVVSGPFGSFTLDGRDDILAAPGIRGGTAGTNVNAIASAVASALQGMSFQVTNVFDGDKIASRLQIRKGQTMNNLGNIA